MKELIEEIRQRSGKMYVSDLCGQVDDIQIQTVLKQIEMGQFALEEWRRAIDYLANGTAPCNSTADVKKFIDEL